MSVIIGLINNGRVIFSSDTLLSHLQDAKLSTHGFKKIYSFELDGRKYLIGAAGLVDELNTFLSILQQYGFVSPFYTPNIFADEMQTILRTNNLNRLTLLIGGFDNYMPIIIRVRINEKNNINQNNNYLVLTPNSVMPRLSELNQIFNSNSHLIDTNPRGVLKMVQNRVAEIDNYRYVNDDFYCEILTSDMHIERQQVSDDGYKMN